jgi:heptosyltransferase-2
MNGKICEFIGKTLLRLVDTPARLRLFAEPVFWLAGFRPTTRSPMPTRVAVIKLDRLGDLVLCSRFLASLRRAWPDARITLLVRHSLLDLARLSPDVDEVIGVPVDEWRMVFDPGSGEYHSWKRQLATWVKFCHKEKLWEKRFDAALLPRWDTDYYGATALAYLMGAPQRWGVSETATESKANQNRGFDVLLTNVIAGKSNRHECLLNEEFLQKMGLASPPQQALVGWVREGDQQAAAETMSAAGLDPSRKTILLCLGAGSRSRMWPVANYAQLLRRVFDFEMVQLATFGTTAEANLGRELRERLGNVVVNLEGKLPLKLLPAAVSLCALYIGSDTGTKHLAAASGRPVFEISCHPLNGEPYWAESPLRFGACGVPNRMVQPERAAAPCERHCASPEAHCILGVSAEKATPLLRSLLAEIGLESCCIGDDKSKDRLPLGAVGE